jgi:hypothetical protein
MRRHAAFTGALLVVYGGFTWLNHGLDTWIGVKDPDPWFLVAEGCLVLLLSRPWSLPPEPS